MMESNIMNISVDSSELEQNSENTESQNNFNSSNNNEENSNEIKFINVNPEESSSLIKKIK